MIYLSGFVFPIENMPAAMQHVTYVIPLRYFIVIVRGLFLKGVGLETFWRERWSCSPGAWDSRPGDLAIPQAVGLTC